jgi:S-DNA-T family DNA segregation ATPase FtsK/SpoIIIE
VSTWRLQVVGAHDRLHDTFVDAEPTATVADLERALTDAGFPGHPLSIAGRSLGDGEQLGDVDLEHGDRIGCGRLVAEHSPAGAGRYVVAVAGPDSGLRVKLHDGDRLTFGRTGADVTLHDPFMSSRHFAIATSPGGVTLTDAGSTNGTMVEGTTVDGEVVLAPGDYVHAGSSVFTVVDIDPRELAVLGHRPPERVFARQFRTAQAALPNNVEAPRPTDVDSPSARSNWWRALLPLITGVGMAAITGRWIFLAVMALAPILIAVDAVNRKKKTERRRQEKAEEYAAELAEFRANVVALRREERSRRRHTAACAGVAALQSEARHRRLWERRPADEDFTSVCVGLAPLASSIQAVDPEDQLEALQWGTPLETNLLATGSLALVGPHGRAQAAARGLVMSLAATHSPTELRIWVLTRDHAGAEWGFARWLPHTFNGDHGCNIMTDGLGWAAAMKSIKQLIDTRAELDVERPLPVHLIVVDGTDLMAPGELADLLANGPQRGVVGLTIDPRLAPEGAGARLTVTEAADTAVFQSRHHPRTEGVIVPEIPAERAEQSARRLAALRPMLHDEQTALGGTVHLVDLLDEVPSPLSGEDLVKRWTTISPNTSVVVGTASDVPMVVDLVRDGPHGLVGGTSGSGKTEFLKTLLVSLCLNNHPDDLSIVIVDFKGGVDHDAVRPIPHVVDVSTNLDIEQFRRTIVMLKAESRRRQDLLASAGSSNLDSYRLARRSRPDLPALPRLLVVVDEFGELLASEGGREQLKELESITRIGRALGLNLLLVTQNFEGALPAQIDANAGLRICLRVGKPAHSKAVLNSGIAATIPDRFVGRAYARFHGRELIEFQTARVAGRRRDLASADADVDVRIVPFETLAAPAPDRRPEDVPVEETDMYTLVGAIRDAAETSGWTRSAVPWPTALPDSISVSSLVSRHDGDDVPVAVMDLPDQQRRRISSISDRDEHVAFIGGPNAPIPEVLSAYATSLALLKSADDVHLYGIDLLGRGLAPLEALPHCGGMAIRNEALALRIVRHLIDVAAERKVAMAATGSSNVWEHAAVTGELPPQEVLLVSGTDRLLMSTEGTASNLLGPLTTLMNEAVGVRIQVVLAGLPRIVTNRLGMNIERRFVFQLADANEYSIVGASKALGVQLAQPRRAIDVPAKRIIQFAQLAAPGSAEGPVIQQLAERLPAATTRPPRPFADVSWPQPWEQAPLDRLTPPAHLVSPLPVAIDTQTGEWTWVDAVDDGPVFAVAGPPKSGRSTAMATMARLASRSGWSVLNVGLSRRSPLATWDDPAISRQVAPDDLAAALEARDGNVMVLLDDLQRLTSYDPLEAALAHRDRVLLVVSGPPDFLGSRLGMFRNFPVAGAGLLLAPSGSLDGSAIGLRRLTPEMVANPRPGRGILAVAGEPSDVQVPLVSLAR